MRISIDELERAAAAGWQAPETEPLGDWLLRAADGFTGRANSALAVGHPGMPLDAAIERVRAWYGSRGLPPMVCTAFAVGQPEESAADQFLAALGWEVYRGAIVMTATAGEIASRIATGAALDVTVRDEPDEGWLSLYRYRGEPPPPVSRKLLMSAPWQAFGSVRQGSSTVAIGRVAASAGWAGITAVEVHEGYRRRGLGTAITAALTAAVATRGLSSIYLQVDPGNTGARQLYERCGFADHHAYRYRIDMHAELQQPV